MHELTYDEIQLISGRGLISTSFTNAIYTDDWLMIGAGVGFIGAMWLNEKRKAYNKPQGTWTETFNCTLNTAKEFATYGLILDATMAFYHYLK